MSAAKLASPKVALVTGASRGIGREIALALAAKGLSVYLAADGTEAELADTVAAAKAGGAPEARWTIVDLGTPGEAERMVETALAAMGRIDVLVNNAGIRCRKPFGAFTRADFAALIEVNLAAAFFASQAVLPAMRAQRDGNGVGGRIIHIASQHGSVASEENALYGTTKAALIHLARNMAYELAKDGIQVNTVSPGPIATQFNKDTWGTIPGKLETMTARVPAGRMGRPEEIAEAVAFLATTDGSFIHGHDLVVDGGYIIH
ncbi:MAG TPA: SDR family oxidoreductase [Rhodopila sp.]|uniref:SDR family NAD(P)-dependent oxidoreductase n=1 Tax=Rhodopila sp. TaxID=2480087 RepID=UPI002CF20E32|nr:SDR family oxidoreductase [Rhodopila sp.]HVY17558.1 SDR family oxidoreductase [Rhodopila sp.]